MKKLQHFIKLSNLKQKDIASHLHVDPSLVSKWSKGLREPSMSQYKELSKLFNVSLDEMMEDSNTVVASSFDMITLLDFNKYQKLSYHVYDYVFFLISVLILSLKILNPYSSLVIAILGILAGVKHIKGFIQPPKSLVSMHTQPIFVKHEYHFNKTSDPMHHKTQGAMYSVIMFLIQPIVLALYYQIIEAYQDTLTTIVVTLLFITTLVFYGFVMLKMIFLSYPKTKPYHLSQYRFLDGIVRVSSIIITIESLLMWLSLIIVSNHPLYYLVSIVSFLLFSIHILLNRHWIEYGKMYTFEFVK